LIPVDKIEVRHIHSDFGVGGPRVSFVGARVFNTSSSDTLNDAAYRLLVDDCETSKTETCATVHDETGHFYVTIPPGQARDVDMHLQGYEGVKILGKARVRVEITAAHAATSKN
jgi:hypothetical protein